MKLGKLSLAAATATLAAGAAAFGAVPAGATPMGAPAMGATAFTGAMIGPSGGTLTGFGITVTFAKGAVHSARYIILGNWPNGLDVAPPSGQAVKTFGLQECAYNPTTGGPATGTCTSEFGNYGNSPSGTERIKGMTIGFTGSQTLGTSPDANGNVNFGTLGDKLVTITIATGGDNVYIYNPNETSTSSAYPKMLPSTSANGVLTFQTFQPIVWTVTSPMA